MEKITSNNKINIQLQLLDVQKELEGFFSLGDHVHELQVLSLALGEDDCRGKDKEDDEHRDTDHRHEREPKPGMQNAI